MTITIIQISIFILSIFTYIQIKRINFLYLNSIVITLLALSFYLKDGYEGFYIEIMMLIIHLIAIFISKEKEKVIKLIAPPTAFLIVLLINNDLYSIFLALAILFFVVGVYQEDMTKNKVFFIVGLMISFLSKEVICSATVFEDKDNIPLRSLPSCSSKSDSSEAICFSIIKE